MVLVHMVFLRHGDGEPGGADAHAFLHLWRGPFVTKYNGFILLKIQFDKKRAGKHLPEGIPSRCHRELLGFFFPKAGIKMHAGGGKESCPLPQFKPPLTS